MKNCFDGLIHRLNMAEERIFELKNIAIESSRNKNQRSQTLKKPEQNTQKLWTNYKRYIHIILIPRREKKKKQNKYLIQYN